MPKIGYECYEKSDSEYLLWQQSLRSSPRTGKPSTWRRETVDQLPDKKVPSRKSLNEEFYRLSAEKKKAYAEYRQVRKDMQEYLTAKQTVEHILGIDRKKREEKEKQREEENRQ